MASGKSFFIAIAIGFAVFGYLYFSAIYISKNLWWIAPVFLCFVFFLMKDASAGKKEILDIKVYDRTRKIDFW